MLEGYAVVANALSAAAIKSQKQKKDTK